MSGERGAYVRVGLLILGGLALLAGFIIFLGGNTLGEGQQFETYFKESVQGLDSGAAVKYRGVTIGRVDKLGLVSAAYPVGGPADMRQPIYRLVYVRFAIDKRLLGAVPRTRVEVAEGLRVRLSPQGITGLYYLELDFVNPKDFPPLTVPWTPKAAYIPSVPSTLAQVQDAAQVLLRRLDQADLPGLLTSIKGLITELRGELVSGDLHTALAAATKLLAAVTRAVGRADIAGLSTRLKTTLSAVDTLAGGKRTMALIASAGAAAHQLALLTAHLAPLVAALQGLAGRANTTLAGLDAELAPTLRDLRATAAALRETSANLSRYPAGTLLGAPPPRDLGPAR